MSNLTQKQEAFCIEYNRCGNASDAYRASYSAEKMKLETINVKASELLKNGKIAVRLKELNQAAVTSSVMTKQEALERLSLSARVTVNDIAEFSERVVGQDENGADVKETIWRIKNSDEISPLALSAIKSVTATKMGPKLELHDPQAAIKQLSDILGWNAPTKINADLNARTTVVIKDMTGKKPKSA
ncbi:MAG: terminase small subunit [Paraglaciecola sp.]|nr:terminase small subunit [Paraglaciecola sp.]